MLNGNEMTKLEFILQNILIKNMQKTQVDKIIITIDGNEPKIRFYAQNTLVKDIAKNIC